jgi:isoprenylcysteine carboxyl methyltransferase (ICMT) family protein YpbQ
MHLETFAVLPLASRVLVAAGWTVFFAFFVFKKKPAAQHETKREPLSRVGILLQMVGFFLVWIIQRPAPRSEASLGALEIALDVLAPIVSIASIWMGLSAVRTLGRQWSYTARLVTDHKLVTEGPYRLVRHPIYTGMLGKLVATNFAFGHPIGLPIAGTIFVIGTIVRVRSEEKLLREAFGSEFEDYARRVPSFVPFLG